MNVEPDQQTNHDQPAYDTVLFDWDGCLARTLGVWMEAYLRTHTMFGLEASREEIARQFGNAQGPIEFGLAPERFDAFWAQMFEDVNVGLRSARLFEGATKLLAGLSAAGCKIALITSSARESLLLCMENNGVSESFDLIVTHDDVTNPKPHPEPIETALRHFDTEKHRSIMIGDSDKDLGAGRNAGIATMLMYPPENEEFHSLDHLMTYEPTFVCRSFDEAASILLGR